MRFFSFLSILVDNIMVAEVSPHWRVVGIITGHSRKRNFSWFPADGACLCHPFL